MNQHKNTQRSADLEEELSRLPDKERLAFSRTWELVGEAASHVPDVPDTDAAWTDLCVRIRAPLPKERTRQVRPDREPRRSTSSLRRRGLVAGGVLLAAVAILAWVWQRPVTVVAPSGQLGSVELADGSAIQLNSETRLIYRPRALPGMAYVKRSVKLEGEAFFDVARGEHPFVVETASAVVEVLGTQFNVRSRVETGAGGTEVTLASGRVRITERRDAAASVLLAHPGERVHVRPSSGTDSSLVSDVATLDHVLAWRRNAFAAIDRPVAAIVAELERRYALDIELEDDVAQQNSMTLLYGPNTSAERILHDICLVQGCRYRPTTQGFAVFMPTTDPNSL